MIDFADPSVLEQWREDWCFSSAEERREMLAAGEVPGYVLVYVELSGLPKDLIDLADPELERRVQLAFALALTLVRGRIVLKAQRRELAAAEAAARASQRLSVARATTDRAVALLAPMPLTPRSEPEG